MDYRRGSFQDVFVDGVQREMRFPAVAILVALAFSGCASAGLNTKADGGLIGNTGEAPGEPIGGIVGGGLAATAGLDLSRRERLEAADAEYRALESTPAGQPVVWRDERTGNSGTVTAAQPYRVGSQDCRPYSHIVKADGATRSVRGTACRNPDGSWTLLN